MLPQPRFHALANRRDFLKAGALLGAGIALNPLKSAVAAVADSSDKDALSVSIFSKHLQFLSYADTAKAAADMGFDGVDFTVRPDGHVLPENAKRDLPRAVDAARSAGLQVETMTTAVDDADDPQDRAILETAAQQGIRYYRMNWFSYPESMELPEALQRYRSQVATLSELNHTLGLVGAYQNHAGTLVGASLWEVWQLLQSSRRESMGIQYDIRHATVEGGLSWKNGLQLALPHIKTIVIKDFKWVEKNGRNEIVNTPVGEGTVDFPSYFRILKAAGIKPPISLHLEYDLGGAQWGQRSLSMPRAEVYAAMEKDLRRLRRLWAEA